MFFLFEKIWTVKGQDLNLTTAAQNQITKQ